MAEPDPKLEIVTIFESDDLVAFSLAKSLLDEAGVEYFAMEDAPAGFGFSPMLSPVRRIQIPACRKDQALELMESISEPDEPGPFESTYRPPQPGVKYPCPCCGFKTLLDRGGDDICPVCNWEDDGQDGHDADRVRGGPNGTLSLTQARQNFREFGACELRFVSSVRPPSPDEI
jgi:hypothetical protein